MAFSPGPKCLNLLCIPEDAVIVTADMKIEEATSKTAIQLTAVSVFAVTTKRSEMD